MGGQFLCVHCRLSKVKGKRYAVCGQCYCSSYPKLVPPRGWKLALCQGCYSAKAFAKDHSQKPPPSMCSKPCTVSFQPGVSIFLNSYDKSIHDHTYERIVAPDLEPHPSQDEPVGWKFLTRRLNLLSSSFPTQDPNRKITVLILQILH